MDELIIALRTLLEGFWGEFTFTTSEVARQLAFIRSRVSEDETDAEIYFRSVKRLGKIVILIPVPFFIIGVFTSCGPLISLIGLTWALFTVLFATAASPVAVFISSLVEADKKMGVADNVENYMATVKKVLYTELAIAIAFLAIPMDNNPWAVPELAVVILFFLLSGTKGKFGKKILNVMASLVAVMVLWSMFSPQSYNNLQSRLRAVDPWVANVIGRSPTIPPGGLTTNQAELNSAVAQAQQAQASAPQAQQSNQVSQEPVMFAPGTTTRYVSYVSGKWTTNIITPPTSKSYRIDIPLHQAIFVKFLDGSVYRMTEEEDSWWGVHRGVFAIMGDNCSGVATISISYK